VSYTHKQGPEPAITYFRSGFHNGRSPHLDEAVTDGILVDLADQFHEIKQAASSGRVVYQKRMTNGPLDRNIDLVVGPAPRGLGGPPTVDHLGWVKAVPADVWLGVEAKSMMTEHHKAQRNRRVEFNAHGLNMHAINMEAVRAGIIIINASDTYKSHTSGKVNQHGSGKGRVTSALRELINIAERTETGSPIGLDAMAACVVVVDNEDLKQAKWLGGNPAPADGQRLSYGRFIERAGSLLVSRFWPLAS
jgi:hypothetical protein